MKLLVVDSGPLIKGAQLERWSQSVVTVKEILNEIKDPNTRQRLQVLPYELTFKEPTREAIQYVTKFSKKTGDYVSLSHVDIKLMALTYQLECEQEQIRGPLNTNTELATEDIPRHEDIEISENSIERLSIEDSESREEDAMLREEPQTIVETPSHPDSNGDRNASDTVQLTSNGDQNIEDSEHDDCSRDDCIDDDNDSDGWITPSNIDSVRKGMGGAFEEEAGDIDVACMTTDYAMQNVLMQMGLNIVSVDGMLIKRLQTYALQCKACFKTVYQFSKQFCPSCGNRTLIKVRLEVSSDGTAHCSSLSDRQFSHKGLRYSLPSPKGGRQSNLPLISPHLRSTFRLPRSREKINPLDPDYVTRGSPFRSNDVTSRGAQIVFKQGGRGSSRPQDGWRRNPNKVKKSKK